MKILFVSHANNNLTYGAEKSLGLLLKNLQCDYDIIFDKRLLRKTKIDEIQRYVGSKCGKIMFAYYPVDFHSLDTYNLFEELKRSVYYTIREFISIYFNCIRAYTNKKYLYKIINNKEYDLIVFNSFVLYKLLDTANASILYVREWAGKNLSKKILNKVNSASGIVFIDQSTKEHLTRNKIFNLNVPSIVLQNPFDMSNVKSVDIVSIKKRYNINATDVVFVIAGRINADKGVDFVLDAFNRANRKDAILLIVGGIEQEFALCLKQKYVSNKNIIFTDEIAKMEEIYAIADYIIRGDSDFGIGRTVYEGLYSGCAVLIQGHSSNIGEFIKFPNYEKRVNFYKPRDVISLSIQIQSLTKVNKNISKYSNADEYICKFTEFANDIIKRHKSI